MSELDDDLPTQREALFQYLAMPTADLRALARRTGLPQAILKQWRDEGEWAALRLQYRSAHTQTNVDLALKERSRRMLHSCDVVLRLLNRDLNRFAREVQPDQHQMVRLMHIISEINKMAVENMDELRLLESMEDERQ